MNNPSNTQIGTFQLGPLIAEVASYNDGDSGCVLRIRGLHSALNLHVRSVEDVVALAASIAEAVRKHTAEQFAAIPVTNRVDPIADQIEAEGPVPAVTPEEAAEILAATDIDSWTVTEGTHSELPDHLKPQRKPIWDRFEDGETPESLKKAFGEVNAVYVQMEYTRWKLAGGKVKEDVTMTPEEKAAIPF